MTSMDKLNEDSVPIELTNVADLHIKLPIATGNLSPHYPAKDFEQEKHVSMARNLDPRANLE